MGHLLETANPEAAQAIKDINPAPEPFLQEPDAPVSAPAQREIGLMPVPDVGDVVLYHPRGSEVRRGRKVVAAIVTWRDEDKRELELCLIHEANDVRQQDHVREWPGGAERGWESKADVVTHSVAADVQRLAGELDELRSIVLGEFETPSVSVLDMLNDIDERVDHLKKLTVVTKGAPKASIVPKAKAAKGK